MFVYNLIQLLTVNVIFLIGLVMNNLFFLFGFAATVYFFFEGKKFLFWFVIIVLYLWAATSFADSLGWVLLSGGFLALLYVSQLAVGTIAEAVGLKKYLVFILEIEFFVFFGIYNIFFLGVG